MRRNKDLAYSLRLLSSDRIGVVKSLSGADEWRELILDMLLCEEENEGLHYIFMTGYLGDVRSGTTVRDHAPDYFRDRDAMERVDISAAIVALMQEVLGDPSAENQELFGGLFFLANSIRMTVPSHVLVNFIRKRDLSDKVRLSAAELLRQAPYEQGVPLSFWQEIDLGMDPAMVLPLVRVHLSRYRVVDAIESVGMWRYSQAMPDLPSPAMSVLLLELFKRMDLRSGSRDLGVAKKEFARLPLWAKDVAREAVAMLRTEDSKKEGLLQTIM